MLIGKGTFQVRDICEAVDEVHGVLAVIRAAIRHENRPCGSVHSLKRFTRTQRTSRDNLKIISDASPRGHSNIAEG